MGEGHHPTVVDRSRESCERLARQLGALVIEGDGTDLDILEELSTGSSDQVLGQGSHQPGRLAARAAALPGARGARAGQ